VVRAGLDVDHEMAGFDEHLAGEVGPVGPGVGHAVDAEVREG
jgi:hypothetical protein